MSQKPYNAAEEAAAASLSRAMVLFCFTACCRLMGLDPVQVIGDISDTLLAIRQKNRPIAEQRKFGIAYERVTQDLQRQIFRGTLAEQMQREEINSK